MVRRRVRPSRAGGVLHDAVAQVRVRSVDELRLRDEAEGTLDVAEEGRVFGLGVELEPEEGGAGGAGRDLPEGARLKLRIRMPCDTSASDII